MNELSNPLNPLYVHPADLTAQQLVSIVFDGAGFTSWIRSMLIALSAKNKIGFINGDVVKPTESDGSAKIRQWQRCNDMVISWIVNSVSKEIADGLIFTENAKDIWEELDGRFEQYNGAQAQLYQVQDQLNQTTQGADSITGYFTKLRKCWEELRSIRTIPKCSCGSLQAFIKNEEDQKVIRFLMGLNDTYNGVRGNILMMNPIPSINGVYSLLIQEEKQREITSQSPLNIDASVMAAKAWSRHNYCQNKGFKQQLNGYNNSFRNTYVGNNYDIRNNYNRGSNSRPNGLYNGRRNNYFCTHCNMERHSNERCYKVHPELRNNKKVTTTKENLCHS